MEIKIIATDLDGTLMSPDHVTITQRTKNALLKAHNKGVKIAIATGRTLSAINNVVKQIPFVDYIIYSNGASVYDTNIQKDIYVNHISPELTKKIITKLKTLPVFYNVYIEGNIFVQDGTQRYNESINLPEVFIKEYTSLTNICEDILKTCENKGAEIISVFSENEEYRKELKNFFEEHNLFVTSSLPDEIEVTLPDSNKGNALKGICEIFNIEPCEVMCFGDAMNDSPMIEFADYSFAMGNACEELKQIAKFVTLSNADDGLAKVVEEYVLN